MAGLARRSFRLGLPAILALLALGGEVAAAGSSNPYVPASLYPDHSHLHFIANLSNSGMDAVWNQDPNGELLMHQYPQDAFLRLGGWTEGSFRHDRRGLVWFDLYDSNYGVFQDGRTGNAEAFHDLALVLRRAWHAPLARRQPSGLVPSGVAGASQTRIIPKLDDGPFIVTSVWWGKSREIEGIAYASPGVMSLNQERRMLVQQIRYASHLSEAPLATPTPAPVPTP